MTTPLLLLALLAFGFAATAAGEPAAPPAELLRNPDFRAPVPTPGNSPADPAASGGAWSLWQPVWAPAACTVRPTPAGLQLAAATAEPYSVGGVTQALPAIKPGQAYAIAVTADLQKLDAPLRQVIVRWHWLRKGQPLHPAGILVRGPVVTGNTARFDDVLLAPADADSATLGLELKWPHGGSVTFTHASVTPTTAPPPRKVKIGTVYLRPKNSTPEKNLALWLAKVDEAGKLGVNIVCLSEAILMVGTDKGAADVAEAIPGPSTAALAAAAQRNHLWIVAGLVERDGERLYNTAVLLSPAGKLAGKYRKIHLPREEWNKGITPGTEYPVFKTEFGTIAIQICYDWFFPEAAELFALHGAEILFAPTWGDTLADADGRANGETVFRVRARDNGLYLVPSVYDGNSMIIDPMGRILTSNRGQEGVFTAEVDFNARERLPWVGEWRTIGPRDRMPETYHDLAR